MANNNNAPVLDQNIKDAIDNYGSKIKTLKDYVTAVRKMPGMYCGGYGNKGFLSLFRELFQNALDQIVESDSPADLVKVYYNENTLEVTVVDNGLGFPFEDMVRMVTSPNTSKNYVKEKGQYSSGMHGQGLKVVNALSSECHVESYRYDGQARRIDLENGYLKKGPYSIKNPSKFQGSIVTFYPAVDVLGEINLEWKPIYHLIKDLLIQTEIGSRVEFVAIDKENIEHKENIINKDGIISKLIANIQYPLIKPIMIQEDTGIMKLRVAFGYDAGGKDGPDPNVKYTAYCNMCPTIEGPHIDGTIDGICKWFVSYMNNIYLNNGNNAKSKTKTKVTAADIKNGLNIMISAACLEPVFIGQAKEQLQNVEMGPFAKDVIYNGLEQWNKSNPQDLLKISKYFKDIADLRMKSENEKVKIATKYQQNSLTGLPSKYSKPTEHCKELVIVEGVA